MKLTQINKVYGKKHVLKDVTLEIPAGKITVMVGPSGSGKSTILRSLNLLVTPESGQYDFNGHQIDFSQKISSKEKLAIRRETGMVFQDYNLFPHKTVLNNVIEGPTQVLKMGRKQASELARELLTKVGMADYSDVYPNELSGGQAQRVAIARALAMKPQYLLLDEPTSALDPELELSVLKVLLRLAREKQSMVLVTHNMAFAKQIADKIVFIEEGQVLYDGGPEEFFSQNNPNDRIKNFIASMTMENLS
ncbi:MAG: amino acid ABC transporter ATP-binding protein [Limosilactobacillus sp.]|jgi:cystine transport system ATP-binding protein|uniref:amino acid ABC transporter ATP-binding protein n=1 Tax=Limosilactobacillus sp. TaxID=2773925 RepID=UPI0025B91045|nr:amino acid ABC transporter ATP-binding protein [Limosilactobacillus sp.]MCI1974559.1 amino acid ABC transporter ATP-binding protein [Limosilactobacillus sp.]MCI2031521.1 amino acid ABC transporter ATP-binding protein [Limosilactobacillus sp.]